MSSPTQQDINVRLQLAGQAYACLANLYANDLKWGRKCDNEQNLFLLNAYLELVESYNINIQKYSSFYIHREFFNPLNKELTFYINGIQISTTMMVSQFAVNQIQLIVDDINNYQSDYTAIRINNNDFTITPIIEGCQEMELTYTTNDPSGTVLTITPQRSCPIIDNNCITEEELSTIFNNISKLTKIGFQSYGFTYS